MMNADDNDVADVEDEVVVLEMMIVFSLVLFD